MNEQIRTYVRKRTCYISGEQACKTQNVAPIRMLPRAPPIYVRKFVCVPQKPTLYKSVLLKNTSRSRSHVINYALELWVSTIERLSPRESLDVHSSRIMMRGLWDLSKKFQDSHAFLYFDCLSSSAASRPSLL